MILHVQVYPGSLKKMDMADKPFCWAIETTDTQYVFSASDEVRYKM